MIFAAVRALIRKVRRSEISVSTIDSSALAQFHAAEYAAERNSVDVWKTLQYAIVPIIFAAWVALQQVRQVLDDRIFYWAGTLVVPLCFVAYQKAMVDALEGLLLIETYVRPRAVALAGTDEFWFHEPIVRRDLPPDLAYAWWWPPSLSFEAPMAMLMYRVVGMHAAAWKWDGLGYAACCGVAYGVGRLSKKGLALQRAITRAIAGQKLSWLSRP